MPNAPIAPGSSHSIILVENLTRGQIVQYAGASGDFNPLHTDEIYATKVAGYQSVFAHGMLTMGMTGKVVTDLFGVRSLRRFGGRFRAQVWPGDTLTAVVTVLTASDDGTAQLSIVTSNQHGTVVFEGTATVSVQQSKD
jgi:acyl dehydratase